MPIFIGDRADAQDGRLNQTLGGFTTDFSGTIGSTAQFDGQIDRALRSFSASFRQPGYGFPRPFSLAIGGGTETEKWTQTSVGSRTWHVAAHSVAILNFIYPADENNGRPKAAADNLRNLNPDILLGAYKNCRTITFSDYDQDTIRPILENSYFKSGSGGATDGDGFSRKVDGSIDSTFQLKYGDILPIDDVDIVSADVDGLYPAAYIMRDQYNQTFTPSQGANFDFIYWDTMNTTKRVEQEDQDWNRDGTAADADWDLRNGAHGTPIVRVRRQGYDVINAIHQQDYAKTLSHVWNHSESFDSFNGARADTGPVILTASDQPVDQVNIMNVLHQQHFGRISGYNDDGTNNAGGNFERGFKTITRQRAYMAAEPLTGTKCVVPGCIIDSSVLGTQARLALARYLIAVCTIAGTWCAYMEKNVERGAFFMDEYIADDFGSITDMSVINSKKGWLGEPIGSFPEFGDSFSSGTRGGTTDANGVYAMEFENGLVLANPKGNGNKTNVALPSPQSVGGAGATWVRFVGGQSPLVNDGSVVWDTIGDTIDMDESTGLFLRRG